MRPNLAFGPIDSVTQYLLYLSVVALGVLLPLLLQKWRTRREQKLLLTRTLAALAGEADGNRRRMLKSRESLQTLARELEQVRDRYLFLRLRVQSGDTVALEQPPGATLGINLALATSTAWDVARLSGALPLMSPAQLSAYTRVHHLQELWLRDRAMLLATAMRAELLELPGDLTRLETLDERLRFLVEARTVVGYHVGLLGTLIDTYGDVLGIASIAASASPPAPTMPAP